MAGAGALTWTIRRWDHTPGLGQRRRREDDGFARVAGPLKDRRAAESGPGPGIRGEVPDDSADTPAQETRPARMNPGKGGPAPAGPSSAEEGHPPAGPVSRPAALVTQIRRLVHAIREDDDAMVEAAVLQLSRRRRIFAPLAIAVGAFAMLFEGLKLVLSNWRLTVVRGPSGHVDLGRHDGPQGSRLPRKVVPPVARRGPGGRHHRRGGHHGRRLFLERRVRLCHRQSRPGPRSGPHSPGPGRTPRPSSAGAA